MKFVSEMASNIKQPAESLWSATAGNGPAGTPYQDESSFDVIIIGGGISGASAALTLAGQGTAVALLEAGTPACKATGRSAGFIVPSFSKLSPARVMELCGSDGERLVRLVANSADMVFSLVRQFGLECEATQNGWFQPVRSEPAFERLQKSARDWLSFGIDGSLHDAAETERLTGTRGYAGCWLAKSGGTVHPVKLVHGLLSRAMEKGLAYFPGTPATSIQRHGVKWKVATSRGTLHAENVLLCTNAQSPELHETLYSSIVPLQVCQIATRPIPENKRRHLLQQGQCLTDTQINLFSYRFDREWRLISGAIPVLPLSDGRNLARRITRRLQQVLSLDFEPAAEFVWGGTASVTSDFLPHALEIGPGAYAVTACNGRGLALSTAMGQTIARAVLTQNFDEVPVPVRHPERVKGRSLKVLGTRLYPIYGSVKDFLRT